MESPNASRKPKIATMIINLNRGGTKSANQVLIIHQNNSMSSNANNLLNDDGEMVSCEEDIKYMKGYVNVIKERFARRSLASSVQPDLVDSVSQSQRFSIGEYQRRKAGQKSANDVNDRRRSASPFMTDSKPFIMPTNKTTLNQNQITKQSVYTKNRKLFASSDDLRPVITSSTSSASPSSSSPPLSSTSSPSSSSSSSDNLYQNKKQNPVNINNSTRNSSASVDHLLNTNEVVKCTYFNEINKDELPKPNFVSSVKNLFERHINSSAANQANLANLERIMHSAINNRQPIKSPSNNTNNQNQNQAFIQASNLLVQKQISVDNLVEKLKHNGTLVYEHSNTG